MSVHVGVMLVLVPMVLVGLQAHVTHHALLVWLAWLLQAQVLSLKQILKNPSALVQE